MRLHPMTVSLCLTLSLGFASCGGGSAAPQQDTEQLPVDSPDQTPMDRGDPDGGPTDLVLEPAAAAGLRSYDDGRNVIILSFLSVKSGTEDRSILHYALDSVPATFTSARLDIPLENIDPGPPMGTFDVYQFSGFGDVRTGEWDLGTLVHSFTDLGGGIQVLSIDVTPQLVSSKAVSLPFLSFNLRGGWGTDRYNFGALGLSAPVLTVTP